jgi:hypothetical protein
MAFGRVPHLNNNDIDAIRAPGGDVTALASVCAAPLPWLIAVLLLTRVS